MPLISRAECVAEMPETSTSVPRLLLCLSYVWYTRALQRGQGKELPVKSLLQRNAVSRGAMRVLNERNDRILQ